MFKNFVLKKFSKKIKFIMNKHKFMGLRQIKKNYFKYMSDQMNCKIESSLTLIESKV